MKLKKTLALGLVAAMAASFTACGSSASSTAAESTASGNGSKTVIEYWHRCPRW